ncbi:MAG TPA: glutamine synthetase type III, partial [Clostridiales bacterium]|nr:glutamine synthetase type III [Clostridiales bacterium]
STLADTLAKKLAVCPTLGAAYEKRSITELSALADEIDRATTELENAELAYKEIGDITAASERIRDDLLPKMAALRAVCDEAETKTAAKYWPFPTYGDLLFGVR